jgi:hypothetical protein
MTTPKAGVTRNTLSREREARYFARNGGEARRRDRIKLKRLALA